MIIDVGCRADRQSWCAYPIQEVNKEKLVTWLEKLSTPEPVSSGHRASRWPIQRALRRGVGLGARCLRESVLQVFQNQFRKGLLHVSLSREQHRPQLVALAA